jgi:putative ABC transport system substrate-binding protein
MSAITGLTSTLAILLLAAPLAVGAQPAAKVPVVGILDYGAPDAARLVWWKALREALQELGYVEGRSIAFEARWPEGRVDRLPDLAEELVRRQVNVIVTGGGEAARAAKQATATIPIVMASGADPVQLGLVVSLARPGGNVTGVTSLSSELISKRLQLLRELLPKVSRVAVLSDETPNSKMSVRDTEVGARILNLEIYPVDGRDPNQLDRAVSSAHRERAGALIVIASPSMFIARRRIGDLALKYRLPTAVGGREYAEAGGSLLIRRELPSAVPPSGGLRRQDPEGCEARRPSGGAADEARAGHQPQDCEGPWPDDRAVAAGAGGSFD